MLCVLRVIVCVNFCCLCQAVYLCVRRLVEEVVRFPGLPPHRQLTYQAKQTISREMEQEKMRRAEQLMLQRNPAVVRLNRRIFLLTLLLSTYLTHLYAVTSV